MLFYGWLEMKDQTDEGHWSVKMRYNTADVSRCNNGSFFQLQSSIFITILTRLQLAWESLITCITIISGFIIPLVNWLTLFRDKTSNYEACTVVPQQKKKNTSASLVRWKSHSCVSAKQKKQAPCTEVKQRKPAKQLESNRNEAEITLKLCK